MYNMIVTCPFCKRYHFVSSHINIICPCGSKFYINTREWWDRKTGKVVKNVY